MDRQPDCGPDATGPTTWGRVAQGKSGWEAQEDLVGVRSQRHEADEKILREAGRTVLDSRDAELLGNKAHVQSTDGRAEAGL